MKWTKVDHRTGEPIKGSGWYICDYVCGEYKAVSDDGRWILTKNGKIIGRYKTLKQAKSEAV